MKILIFISCLFAWIYCAIKLINHFPLSDLNFFIASGLFALAILCLATSAFSYIFKR